MAPCDSVAEERRKGQEPRCPKRKNQGARPEQVDRSFERTFAEWTVKWLYNVRAPSIFVEKAEGIVLESELEVPVHREYKAVKAVFEDPGRGCWGGGHR